MANYLIREPGSVEAFSEEVNLRRTEGTTLVRILRNPGKEGEITKPNQFFMMA